jgi:hypothetical protein
MPSSIPSRSTDPDPNLPDTRFRSLSLSNSSQASHSVARESLSRRSRTPKAKRKSISNRLTPYSSPALGRSSRSKGSTTTPDSNNQDFDNDADLSLTDINIVYLSPEQNHLHQEQDAFERSSGDESQVSDFDSTYLFSFHLLMAGVSQYPFDMFHYIIYQSDAFRTMMKIQNLLTARRLPR